MFERLRRALRSERVHRVVEQVHELRDRGDQNEAERLLRRRHAEMPQEPEFALQLALQLWDDGENGTDEARQLLRTAAALGSDNPGTLVRAASVMEALGGASEIEAWVRAAERLAPADFALAEELLFLTGVCQFERGEFDAAEETLRAAFYSGETHDFGYHLARTYLQLGDPQRAIAVVEEGLRRGAAGDRLSELHRAATEDLAMLAAEQASADGPDAVIAVLRDGLRRVPGSPTISMALARELTEQGPQEAFELLVAAAAGSQDHADGLVYAAFLMINLGGWSEVREWVTTAQDSGDVSGEYQAHLDFALGAVAWHDGELDGARELLEQAFRACPDLDQGYHLAVLYAQQGRRDDALQLVSAALATGPDDAGFRELRNQLLDDAPSP